MQHRATWAKRGNEAACYIYTDSTLRKEELHQRQESRMVWWRGSGGTEMRTTIKGNKPRLTIKESRC